MKRKDHNEAVLKDALNDQTLEKLKLLKKDAVEAEENSRKAALAKKEEERKQREKNKSFEELLNESSLDWKKYKN